MGNPLVLSPVLPALIEKHLELPKFMFVDVGCSGGICREWRDLAFVDCVGFDPLVAEIERLRRAAPRNHTYIDAFVTGPAEPPSRIDSWFRRASFWKAHEILNRDHIKQVFNSGAEVVYSDRKITLDEYFEGPIYHFLKTDTDGYDLNVLKGAQASLANAVGVMCEANFHAYEGDATVWRNIDKYLVEVGLAIADITPVRYTRGALPGQFVHPQMANTIEGAVAWADCLYLRDPQELAGEHLVRLAMVAEIYGLPDVAAEALLRYADEVGRDRVEPLLDGLVRYSPFPKVKSYAALISKFESEPGAFVVKS